MLELIAEGVDIRDPLLTESVGFDEATVSTEDVVGNGRLIVWPLKVALD